MTTPAASFTVAVAQLHTPAAIQQAVAAFVGEVLDLFGDDIVAVIAFGSAVTGDFDPGESDVNLFVVHRTLDIQSLEKVAGLSRRWLRRRMLAPRFLSRRNFEDYVRHFPVDVLAIRDAHVVLCGEPLLAGATLDRDALRWQSTYEIKAMRMRVKQQFWRVAGDRRAIESVLVQRYTSLTHLMRAALALRGLPTPPRRHHVVAAAIAQLGVDAALDDAVTRLRRGGSVDKAAAVTLFEMLLDTIRAVDAAITGDHA